MESSKKSGKESNLHTKLPKLVITQFKGIQTDWLRFWNQFQSGIDETDIGQVTKFSYLKELLDPKVRACVDIWVSKYGKDSEVINAYVQNIIGLPTVTGSQPNKIHEFYETLVTSVQSLETLGKLTQVSGYVRMTLDKLEGIRSDLVRTDDSWQEWKFPNWLKHYGNGRNEIHLSKKRKWRNQSRDGQVGQRVFKRDSKSKSQDPVFTVMMLVTDRVIATRWSRWQVEGSSWEKNNVVSTVRELDTRPLIVAVKRHVNDARGNITHRFAILNQYNKCWWQKVKAR